MRLVALAVPAALGAGLVDLERQYTSKLVECENIQTLPEFDRHDGWCPPLQFHVLESESPIQREAVIGSGGTGLVLGSTDGRFALKIPKPDAKLTYTKARFCRERTLYDYIHRVGFIDFIPTIYQPTPLSVVEPCLSFLIVTDKVGPYSLSDLCTTMGGFFATNKQELLRIGIRLVEMTELLFKSKVVHRDINQGNVMFSDPNDIAASLKLIDLELSSLHSETHPSEYLLDLIEALNRIVELSTDSFGRSDRAIAQIRNYVLDQYYSDTYQVEASLFREVVAMLHAVDTTGTLATLSGGLMVSAADLTSINWTQVPRVRIALQRQTGMESHLRMTLDRSRISWEKFQDALADGFIFNDQMVAFTTGSIGRRSKDNMYRFKILGSSEMEEHLREKRLGIIFRENGIIPFAAVPDGWIEGNNLLVDAISFSESLISLKLGNRSYWIVGESMHVAAARIAISMIRLLEKIHNLGLVHGRVGSDKIFGRVSLGDRGSVDLDNLVLDGAGWGRMYVTDDGFLLPQDLGDCNLTSVVKAGHSPAEIMGFCPGRFDDLYRLSETLHQFVSGKVAFYGSSHTDQRIFIMKNMWAMEDAPEVFNNFHRAMHTSSLERDTARPDYAGWIEKFQTVLTESI